MVWKQIVWNLVNSRGAVWSYLHTSRVCIYVPVAKWHLHTKLLQQKLPTRQSAISTWSSGPKNVSLNTNPCLWFRSFWSVQSVFYWHYCYLLCVRNTTSLLHHHWGFEIAAAKYSWSYISLHLNMANGEFQQYIDL